MLGEIWNKFYKSFIYILDFISLTRTYLRVAATKYVNAVCTAYLWWQFIFIRKCFSYYNTLIKKFSNHILSHFCPPLYCLCPPFPLSFSSLQQ